ncbi:MAG: hypothetical protein AAFX81_12720 [Pseudomonadota bacterium]
MLQREATVVGHVRGLGRALLDDAAVWRLLAVLLAMDTVVVLCRAGRKWGVVDPLGLVPVLADAGNWLATAKVLLIVLTMIVGWRMTGSRAYAALAIASALALVEVVGKFHLVVAAPLGAALVFVEAHWRVDLFVGKAVYFGLLALALGVVVVAAWRRCTLPERGLLVVQTTAFAAVACGSVGTDLVNGAIGRLVPSAGPTLARLELAFELVLSSVAVAVSIGVCRSVSRGRWQSAGPGVERPGSVRSPRRH